jgi:hypothetical protein
MVTQVMNGIRILELATHIFALQRGLLELEKWADAEWFVLDSIVSQT